MTSGVNLREMIVEALQLILEKGQMCHYALSDVLTKHQYLEKQERAFFSRSVEGTLEYLLRLDYILDSFSKTPVEKMKPVIRNLLRMSLYHIYYMDSVPDRAVVNEAVELTDKKGLYGLKGFVNGLLRNIIRSKGKIEEPEEELKRLEVAYSIPAWIIEEWQGAYGKEEAKLLLEAVHKEYPLNVRVNVAKIQPEACMKRLKEEGVTVRQHPYLSECLEISGYNYLRSLASFREGLFQVQDVSSMLVGHLAASYLKENPQGQILDMCSAPGGKSLYIAQRCPQAQILARDISDHKLSIVEENIRKSGVNNIKTEVFDARELDEGWRKRADVVIADLPCSGLGVLRKKRDIAYRTKREDVESLVTLQREMLQRAAEYVKPGGILIYSTCTITRAENQENRAWFLDAFDFEKEDISALLPKALQEKTTKDGYLQLLFGKHESDGFFISVMRKQDAC